LKKSSVSKFTSSFLDPKTLAVGSYFFAN